MSLSRNRNESKNKLTKKKSHKSYSESYSINLNNNNKIIDKNVVILNGFMIKVYDTVKQITIKVGNKSIDCILLNIDKTNLSTAELNQFNFHNSCNIYKNLDRISGTKNMMNTLLQFIKSNYKSIKNICLIDSALYNCSKKDNFKSAFSLYDLYLFKYNSTYYTYNYGFKFYDENDTISHNENIKLIKDYKIDKLELEKFLKMKGKNIKVSSIDNDINELILNINDNELAISFIKRFKFDENTCYLMKYFFEFIRETLDNYKTLNGSYYILDF